MNTINMEDARKDFPGDLNVGEYVAWWISGEKRYTAVSNSFPTIERCISIAELLSSTYADDTLDVRVIVDGAKV